MFAHFAIPEIGISHYYIAIKTIFSVILPRQASLFGRCRRVLKVGRDLTIEHSGWIGASVDGRQIPQQARQHHARAARSNE